jgi:hypothetical protein
MTDAFTNASTARAPSPEDRRAYIDSQASTRAIVGHGVYATLPFLGGVFLDRRALAPWSSWRDFCVVQVDGPGEVLFWVGRCEWQFSMPDGLHRLPTMARVASLPVVGDRRPGPRRHGGAGWRLKRLGLYAAWVLLPRLMAAKFARDAAREAERERKGAEALALVCGA